MPTTDPGPLSPVCFPSPLRGGNPIWQGWEKKRGLSVPFLGLLLFSHFAGCGGPVDPATLPRAASTLSDVGKRLGRRLSPDDLARLGESESRLVAKLDSSERLSLAQGYLRFRVDRPTTIVVAVPEGHTPFWLADGGFTLDGRRLEHPSGAFVLWSKNVPAGTVGLGVNGLDRTSRGHYTVFVPGPAILSAVSPPTVRVVPATAGATPYSDDARPFAAIPTDLAGGLLIQPRVDWRHASALVRGKVWKTRLPSGPAADQVVVSLGEDPARSLGLTWRTDPSVGKTSVRIEKVDGSSSSTVRGTSVAVASDGLLNDPIIHRHRARVDGLEPDTTYRYSVGDGSAAGWSAWQTVRTGPEVGRDYAFLAMGDPQCGLEEWGKLLHEARNRRPDAGFLLIAGDLVDRGNERSNWDHFFQRAAGVFEGLPVMPAVGNHEYLDKGPEIFSSAFVLPENGPADVMNRLNYRFEYSDCFVAVLDSNPAVYSTVMAQRQAEWLDVELSRTKARWKVVMFHHPITPSHPSREQPQLAAAWVPVFDKHGVDLVLQGHDHAYLRTYPMRAGRTVKEGTVYVVSVSGQKFVPLADRPYTTRGFADVATYQTIDISPRSGTLLYRAYDVAGKEWDRMELRKPGRDALADR